MHAPERVVQQRWWLAGRGDVLLRALEGRRATLGGRGAGLATCPKAVRTGVSRCKIQSRSGGGFSSTLGGCMGGMGAPAHVQA